LRQLLHVKGRITLLPKIIKSKKTLSVIIKMLALKFSIFLLSFAALTEAQDSSYLYHGPLRPPCPLFVTKFTPKETKYSISDFFVQASITIINIAP
jgi:hypothetical protein